MVQTRFYTGIPEPGRNPLWHGFWTNKLHDLRQSGIAVFSRRLRYNRSDPNDTGHEKGIDVRIAIDLIREALENAYDVALVFSQDQDLSEVAVELRRIAKTQQRWIKIASAFPIGTSNRRGINSTDWITVDRATYDTCLDPKDHRPAAFRPAPPAP